MKNLKKYLLGLGVLALPFLGCEPKETPQQETKKEVIESLIQYTETKTQEPKIIPVKFDEETSKKLQMLKQRL